MGVVKQRTQGLVKMANLGGHDAGRTHAAVHGCLGRSFGGGAGAAGCRGEQGGEAKGEWGGGRGGMGGDLGVGGWSVHERS
jgi:hypothetical protein